MNAAHLLRLACYVATGVGCAATFKRARRAAAAVTCPDCLRLINTESSHE